MEQHFLSTAKADACDKEILLGRVIWLIRAENHKLFFIYSHRKFTLEARLFNASASSKSISVKIWKSKNTVIPARLKRTGDVLRFYFYSAGKLNCVKFSLKAILQQLIYVIPKEKKQLQTPHLQRVTENPIITPSRQNRWENNAVFNAGAVFLANKVHFIYRAIGESGLSVFGYAASNDGIHINERAAEPAFVAENIFPDTEKIFARHYCSGGSFWGCEDPRLTQIDDEIFMTYTVFDGNHPPNVALTSIKVDDFLQKQWNWEQPKIISRADKVNKNWVVFPEKINGKYAILHSITPKISIAYLNSMHFFDKPYIESNFYNNGRDEYWDNWVRGAGPPPIKTELGWLVLYHAMDKKDPGKYKIGAMVLDINTPEKILYRSNSPLLEPDVWYENNGHKKGVVYTCGAALLKDDLYVYYGGSDKFICAATIKLNTLLNQLRQGKNTAALTH